uniref:Uncharacterized protein n=1 Tax=Lepeophtheirus salmonis TaxID=72036 RepID=A0A0K2T1L5_LEPSM
MSRNECQQLFQSSNARINNDPKVKRNRREIMSYTLKHS